MFLIHHSMTKSVRVRSRSSTHSEEKMHDHVLENVADSTVPVELPWESSLVGSLMETGRRRRERKRGRERRGKGKREGKEGK